MRTLERSLQQQGFMKIVGIDEAGRGPLAGPVVAAAVYIPSDRFLVEVADSKSLSPKKREAAYEEVLRWGCTSIGVASAAEIDQLNILKATFLAMRRAVTGLDIVPDFCLVDGSLEIPDLHVPQMAVVKGDATCFSVAAASIVAKVVRDRLMEGFDIAYPEYGFAQHKGYPTAQHRQAIQEFGVCPIHRVSFGGVQKGYVS